MERFIKDKNNGIMYELVGDYYYPCFIRTKPIDIGRYGNLRATYLKENHKVLYYNLLTSGKLEAYLRDIDITACEMKVRIVDEMAKVQGVNEVLKQTDMIKWVGMMNNIRNCADEIVLNDIIYA